MINWYESNRIVIVYFRPFSSGNFLANILCFNKNFVPKFVLNPMILRYNERVNHGIDEEELNKIKMEQIFSTIPVDKDDCHNWWKYELGCAAFWAKDTNIFFNPSTTEEFYNNTQESVIRLLKNKYCFIMAHYVQDYKRYIELFPNATVVQLVNDNTVHERGKSLKEERPEPWPAPRPYVINPELETSIKFDIGSIWNKLDFFNNIKKLLDSFPIEDKTLDYQSEKYYNQYMELYV